jgi:hypothetical protein
MQPIITQKRYLINLIEIPFRPLTSFRVLIGFFPPIKTALLWKRNPDHKGEYQSAVYLGSFKMQFHRAA